MVGWDVCRRGERKSVREREGERNGRMGSDRKGYESYADIFGKRVELSLTVPITNSLAFLFTVLGEWWAEGKVIGRDTWLGMGCVLGGIALCVSSKSG